MPNDDTIINHTKKWLSNVIIGHGFCPFAKREYDRDTIHYAVIRAVDLKSQLEHIITQCAALDNDPAIETTLLIFPGVLPDFEDYLDLLGLAADLLIAEGYEGVYQLASFHPDYCFEGAAPDDPANYTNRSPYPILHILREASVERAVESHSNPENIPARNTRAARDLGAEVMKGLLAECYDK